MRVLAPTALARELAEQKRAGEKAIAHKGRGHVGGLAVAAAGTRDDDPEGFVAQIWPRGSNAAPLAARDAVRAASLPTPDARAPYAHTLDAHAAQPAQRASLAAGAASAAAPPQLRVAPTASLPSSIEIERGLARVSAAMERIRHIGLVDAAPRDVPASGAAAVRETTHSPLKPPAQPHLFALADANSAADGLVLAVANPVS